MERSSFAALVVAGALAAAGPAGAQQAPTPAEEIGTSAGMIAGAADACGATDTSMFRFKAEQAIEEVAIDEEDATTANDAFLEAKRSARTEQRLHAPMPCRDVLRLYRKQPLWENY